MKKSIWKNKVIIIIVALLIFFILYIVGNLIRVYDFLSNIHATIGIGFAFIMALLFFIGILWPLLILAGMQKAVDLPAKEEYSNNHEARKIIEEYLKRHPLMREQVPELIEGTMKLDAIHHCMGILDQEAEKIMRGHATRVFISTTISQNGSLDGIFVFLHGNKMIWEIIKLYQQRPTPRKVLVLYGNIMGTFFLTRGIEDMDLLDEQLEPIISLLFGSLLTSAVPRIQAAVNLIINSAIRGTANAFLLLRIGAIAKTYAKNEKVEDKLWLRRSATMQALPLLKTLVAENGKTVRRAVVKLSKKLSKESMEKGASTMGKMMRNPFGKEE